MSEQLKAHTHTRSPTCWSVINRAHPCICGARKAREVGFLSLWLMVSICHPFPLLPKWKMSWNTFFTTIPSFEEVFKCSKKCVFIFQSSPLWWILNCMLTWAQDGISTMRWGLQAMCSGGKEFLFVCFGFFSPSAFANSLLWNFKALPSQFCFQAAKYEGEKVLLYYKHVVMFYKQMLGKEKKYFKLRERNFQARVKCYYASTCERKGGV